MGALRRCESLVWLATRRTSRLASHPNPAAKFPSQFLTSPYSGTAKRKGRQQTNWTYCQRATFLLYRQSQFVAIGCSRSAPDLSRSSVGICERPLSSSPTLSAAWAKVEFQGRPGGRWENRRRLLWADGRYPAIGFHRLLAERYPPYSFAKCKNVGASGGWSHQLVHGPTMHRGVAIAKS